MSTDNSDLRGLAAREAGALTPQECPWCHQSGLTPWLHGDRRHATHCPAEYGDSQTRAIVAVVEALAARVTALERQLDRRVT